jgi:hypothetical protein
MNWPKKKRFYSKQPKSLNQDDMDPFVRVDAYIPKSIYLILRQQSRLKGLPISRLINVAVDNELDAPEPFFYQTELPDPAPAYHEYQYAEEAQSILEYLSKIPKGTGLDLLMLARRDMGITDKEKFLLGFRELKMKNLVEAIEPIGTRFNYYEPDYRYYRAMLGPNAPLSKPKRFRRVEEESTKRKKRIYDHEVERGDNDEQGQSDSTD